MTHGGRETEIKLAAPDAAAGRALLRRAGFRVSKRRVLETNTVFDTADRALARSACLLRVRAAGRRATLTFKGPPEVSKHKSREELELEIAGARAMTAIVQRLGFQPVFRYEKYRTEYRRAGGLATLDETPIGVYLELEGAPAWIDRTARQMGFTEDQYITASYAGLYFESRRRLGTEPGDMVFEAAEKPPRKY
ncbi:MAG: class IV adenylate cyclase [Bryobacteraceae bacterium]|jgi:adenylate cyclase class 2